MTMTFALGFISFIKNPILFKNLAIIFRFIQGFGDIVLQVTCYSVVTSMFSNNLEKYISYIELIAGLGLSLGPAMGSVVYPYLNYSGTMYFFGLTNILAMTIVYYWIPDSLNNSGKAS
jgi:MFS family permease